MELPLTLLIAVVLIVVVLVLLVGIGLSLKRLYRVPRSNEAIVRTGGRGPAVGVGGGLLVLPVIHQATTISMEAVSISINRTDQQALRTQDKYLADVEGTMLVQVDGSEDAKVVLAAQSLGAASPDEIEHMVEAKTGPIVTDAMRSASMQSSFEDLNVNKESFAEAVRTSVEGDMTKLGLKLISVTITEIRQRAFDTDDMSVHTAEGRRNASMITEKARQEANKIEKDTEAIIAQQNVDAEEQKLTQKLRQARLDADNARQIEEYQAQQAAETRKNVLLQQQSQAEAEQAQARAIAEATAKEAEATERAQIAQREAISVRNAEAAATQQEAAEKASIRKANAEAARKVAEEEAKREEAEAEIAKQKAIEAATIAKQREIEAANIEKQKTVEVAEQERQQAVETAEVDRQKAVAVARAEEADARATQASAEAKQRQAEESIVTVKAKAEAERAREVEVIKADESRQREQIKADQQAYVETKKAEAERDAAQKRAEAAKARATGEADAVKAAAEGEATAKKVRAQGDADAIRIEAETHADTVKLRADADAEAAGKQASAKKLLAEATLKEGQAVAEAARLRVEAENSISNERLMTQVAVAAIEQAPAAIRELMQPIAAVSDVKVLQVNGLGGDGEHAAGGVPGQIIETALLAAGVLPYLKGGAAALADNPDVKKLTGVLGKAATGALGAAVQAVAEADLTDAPDNGGASA